MNNSLNGFAEAVKSYIDYNKMRKVNDLVTTLSVYENIKTVAIFGYITNEELLPKHIVAVNSGCVQGRHAEDLLLVNIKKEDIYEETCFIYSTRIPCYECMENILAQPWKKLRLAIPSTLDVNSKWFSSQVKALDFMNSYTQRKEEEELNNIEVYYND